MTTRRGLSPPLAASGERDQHKIVRLPLPDDDGALVDALRAGHPDAQTALFQRYGAHVRRVLIRVMGLDSEIADLLHEVFIAALTGIDDLERGTSLKPWLTSISVFTARGAIRKRSRRAILQFVPFVDYYAAPATTASAETHQSTRALYLVLSTMPVDERIVFSLRFVDGMALHEIAEACNVSRATVIRRLARAQKQFIDRASKHPALVDWLQGGSRWTGA